jgi:hypothetical protein
VRPAHSQLRVELKASQCAVQHKPERNPACSSTRAAAIRSEHYGRRNPCIENYASDSRLLSLKERIEIRDRRTAPSQRANTSCSRELGKGGLQNSGQGLRRCVHPESLRSADAQRLTPLRG